MRPQLRYGLVHLAALVCTALFLKIPNFSAAHFFQADTRDYECYNLNTPETNISQIIQNPKKCIKMWTERDCKGISYFDSNSNSIRQTIRSVSGCSRCNQQDGSVGFHCTDEDNRSAQEQCISLHKVCDGINDNCKNSNDEVSCTEFGDHQRSFEDGLKKMPGYQCQGESDDFYDPPSPCIPVAKFCDRTNDCPNGDDERNCNLVEKFGCIRPNGDIGYQCQGPGKNLPCIQRWYAGDWSKDCPHGDDERGFQDGRSNGKAEPLTVETLNMTLFKVYNATNYNSGTTVPDIPIIAYERSNRSVSLDAMTVEFKKTDKVVIFIPGYATEKLEKGKNLTKALFQRTEDVGWVVLVDWRRWSIPSESENTLADGPLTYNHVADVHVPIVGEHVRHFLVNKMHSDNIIYIVGYGLGARIAEIVVKLAKDPKDNNIVDRITALNPPNSIFEECSDIGDSLRVLDPSFESVVHSGSTNKSASNFDIFLTENECKKLAYSSLRETQALFATADGTNEINQ